MRAALRRLLRILQRRRHRVIAAVLGAVALSAMGIAIATAHTWASCHSFNASHAYPRAYPHCRAEAQSDRPKIMAGAGAVFLVLAVGAIYFWTEEVPAPAKKR